MSLLLCVGGCVSPSVERQRTLYFDPADDITLNRFTAALTGPTIAKGKTIARVPWHHEVFFHCGCGLLARVLAGFRLDHFILLQGEYCRIRYTRYDADSIRSSQSLLVELLTVPVSSIYQSNGRCLETCQADYAFAVVQYKSCWCTNYVPADQASVGDCDSPCPGYPDDLCGNADKGLFGYIAMNKVQPSGTSGAPGSTGSATSSSSSVSTFLIC